MVHHDVDVDCVMNGLVVVIQLLLVGAHVPGGNCHDAVCAVCLCGLAHLDNVAGAVCAGGGYDLDAVLMAGLYVCLVDCDDLVLLHCDKLAGGAGGDNAGNAVLCQELGNFLDACEVDALVLVERGYNRNVNTLEFLSCHDIDSFILCKLLFSECLFRFNSTPA